MRNKDQIVDDLNELLSDHDKIIEESRGKGNLLSRHDAITRYETNVLSRISNIVGKNSIHYENALRISQQPRQRPDFYIKMLKGIVEALIIDINKGYLDQYEATVRHYLFKDYIDFAEELFKENLKDPAAIIASVSLELHIKKLASLNSIPLIKDKKNRTGHVKCNDLNIELMKKGVYNKTTAMRITSFLQIRNLAVHAEFDKYKEDDVKQMIAFIRSFIHDHPA